jgi:outer membrane protein, adhesin transport system
MSKGRNSSRMTATVTVCGTAAALMLAAAAPVSAMTLEESVRHAVQTNPQIGEAIANREATEFELRQARGLYRPRVDLEASGGVRYLDNESRRFTGQDDELLYPREVGITLTQKLFDGFGRRGEVERQASRVDGASLRVLERSEFIALAVSREYLELILKGRVVDIARQNIAFHEKVASDIGRGASSGRYSSADRTQANERLQAARARLTEAEEELIAARIRFNRLVARSAGQTSRPPSVAGAIPNDLASALNIAMQNNPSVRLGQADIDAAHAQIKIARADYYPKLYLEGTARTGEDIYGDDDTTNDLQARVVLRWNLYDGGIKDNNVMEQKQRVNEERMQLQQVYRDVEEVVRRSWDRRGRQSELTRILTAQLSESQRTVDAYTGQFKVGRRSLLDVLDAQNTTFNTQVLLETAETSAAYADYQLAAAMGMLLRTLGIGAPETANDDAREKARLRKREPEQPASLDLNLNIQPSRR